MTDEQTAALDRHRQSLYSAVRVDGKVYRLMGREVRGTQGPVLEQKSLTVLPTRTIYTFAGAGVALTLTFLTPSFPGRPRRAVAAGHLPDVGRRVRRRTAGHDVSLYFDASSDLAVNTRRAAGDVGPLPAGRA